MKTDTQQRAVRRLDITAAGLVSLWSISLVLVCVSVLLATTAGPPSHRYGPLVQRATATGFSVVWWSPLARSGEMCLTGPDGATRTVPAQRNGDRFEATLRGLEPGTWYDYRIVMVDLVGETHEWGEGRTHTAAPPGAPFSFSVFGDSGSGKKAQYRLAQVMARHPADLLLHVGDLVYDHGAADDYGRKFFMPYQDILARTPFYPVLGNHDVKTEHGRPFLETFSFPENAPPELEPGHCYAFRYGNALFAGLDSTLDNQTLHDVVLPWLRRTLNRTATTWKFVFFHHPPYTSGRSRPDTRIQRLIVPVLEAGGVDLVFCGHDHNYERTVPLAGGQADAQRGIVYVITGAGGKSLRPLYQSQPYSAVFNGDQYSFTHLEIAGGRLTLRQISERDEVIDVWFREK